MTAELIIQTLGIWISRYIAIFCLISLLAWGGGAYFLLDKWTKPVRDTTVYLVTIGLLTLVLAIRPLQPDVLFWPPLTWFCFSMLFVMELLWLSFLIDAALTALRRLPERLSQNLLHARPQSSGVQNLRK